MRNPAFETPRDAFAFAIDQEGDGDARLTMCAKVKPAPLSNHASEAARIVYRIVIDRRSFRDAVLPSLRDAELLALVRPVIAALPRADETRTLRRDVVLWERALAFFVALLARVPIDEDLARLKYDLEAHADQLRARLARDRDRLV